MKHKIAFLMIILLFLASGCIKRVGLGPTAPQKDEYYQVNYNGVGLINFHENNISFEDIGHRFDEHGLLVNWAYMRNRGSYSYELNLRTTYYDAAKLPLESTGWEKVIIAPLEVAHYKSNASRPDAKFFYIEVREGL